MKKRKEALLHELEDIQLQLIDIQYRLDASKRKPVPTIPIIYPEERHQDPFHVLYFFYISLFENYPKKVSFLRHVYTLGQNPTFYSEIP